MSGLTINISGQDKQEPKIKTVEPEIGYICDAGRNFSGGMETGNAYMGLAYAGMLLHTDKIWKGGEFTIDFMNTHGHNLSANHTGDIQVVSNIENGDYTFLYQLLFTQKFSKGYITIGIHDLNAEFAISEYGSALTNSSFGIHSSFSLNFPTSLYPKNALAVLGCYNLTDALAFRTGLYDSDAGSLADDPHNLDWSIQGLMSISEMEFHSRNTLSTMLKVGGYYLSEDYPHLSDTSKSSTGNYGLYLVCDQKLINNEVRGLGAFMQLGYAPEDRNPNTLYAGIGLNLLAPFKKRPDDIVACGLACSMLHDDTYECDMELNYNFTFNQYISIQPALHYIINPGASHNLDNAFAGFLRISAGF